MASQPKAGSEPVPAIVDRSLRERRSVSRSETATLTACLLVLLTAAPAWAEGEALSAWQYQLDVPAAGAHASPWTDFILTPEVFDAARYDLADLRLYNAAGVEVPYALRVLRPESRREAIELREFNRVTLPDGAEEVTLDLLRDGVEHNQFDVAVSGENFRRRAVLEGSSDQAQWGKLAEEWLMRFDADDRPAQDRRFERMRIDYPPARYRYLRLRVEKDPYGTGQSGLRQVQVFRKITTPGEFVSLPGELGVREATKAQEAPASAWIIDLGGKNVPCDALEVEVTDADFVRDWELHLSAGPDQPFYWTASGTWRRQPGEKPQPMPIAIPDRQAARLKLIVIDHRNPPLNVPSVAFRAPVRQVVVSREGAAGGLRLYVGNPKAMSPNYDFARNLPGQLQPAPQRLQLGARQASPGYVPEPLPFTERWPWVIYAVLAAASAVLGGVIVNVGRLAIKAHDAVSPNPTEP